MNPNTGQLDKHPRHMTAEGKRERAVQGVNYNGIPSQD